MTTSSTSKAPSTSPAANAKASTKPPVDADFWNVPRLIALGFTVLGTFFVFIYNVSP